MKAVILAAGLGNRLQPLTLTTPKPLVTINEKPLIDHVLDSFLECGIQEFIVVGGYKFEQLDEHLSSRLRSAKITTLKNDRYEEGNILSLMAAADHLRGDILISNADHIYPTELIGAFIEDSDDGISLACDFDRDLIEDDMKIQFIHENLKGRDTRVLRAIGKFLPSPNGGYIGMTLIGESHLTSYLYALHETVREKGSGASVEDVLVSLIKGSVPLNCIDLSGFGWVEVDTLDDKNNAEAYMNSKDWKICRGSI